MSAVVNNGLSVSQVVKLISMVNVKAYGMAGYVSTLKAVLKAKISGDNITVQSSYTGANGKSKSKKITGKVVCITESTVTVFAATKDFPAGKEWVAWLSKVS